MRYKTVLYGKSRFRHTNKTNDIACTPVIVHIKTRLRNISYFATRPEIQRVSLVIIMDNQFTVIGNK